MARSLSAQSFTLGESISIDYCKYNEKFSDWATKGNCSGDQKQCKHEWVYAERADLNPTTMLTTAVYCPCGCPGSEYEARVCKACLLHESRLRSWWYTIQKHESEYIQLLNKKNKGQ